MKDKLHIFFVILADLCLLVLSPVLIVALILMMITLFIKDGLDKLCNRIKLINQYKKEEGDR